MNRTMDLTTIIFLTRAEILRRLTNVNPCEVSGIKALSRQGPSDAVISLDTNVETRAH